MAKTMFMFCKKCGEKRKHWDNRGTEKEKALGAFVCSVCKNPVADKNKTKQKRTYASPSVDAVPSSMYGKWVTEVVIAFIYNGTVKNIDAAIEATRRIEKEYRCIFQGATSATSNIEDTTSIELPDAEDDTVNNLEVGTDDGIPTEAIKELDDDLNIDNLDLDI